MPSTDLSRRRLVAGGVGCLAVAIAGCTGTDESGTTVEHNASEGADPGPSDEYDALTLRSADEDLFVYPDGEPPDEQSPPPYRRAVDFVVSEEQASSLRIDDDAVVADESPDGAGAADARAFVEGTDFETESIAIEQRTIDDCYRRHVLRVRAGPDEFETRYCQTLRSPETPCEAERSVMEAIFLRVEQPYDDAPSSRSSGDSRSCPDAVFESDAGSGARDGEDDR